MKTLEAKVMEKAARMLRSVSHPVRIAIINMLVKHKKLSVTEIQELLGVSQSMTSQHLAALKNVHVVKVEKEANVRYYSILNKNILKLLECVERCAA